MTNTTNNGHCIDWIGIIICKLDKKKIFGFGSKIQMTFQIDISFDNGNSSQNILFGCWVCFSIELEIKSEYRIMTNNFKEFDKNSSDEDSSTYNDSSEGELSDNDGESRACWFWDWDNLI